MKSLENENKSNLTISSETNDLNKCKGSFIKPNLNILT